MRRLTDWKPWGILMALLLIAVTASGAATIDSILQSEKLKTAYSPVLLDYLLEEGVDHLPEAQRKQALDQLVTALKADIEITPEEQKAAAMAAAASGLAQLLGGRGARELGTAAGGATYQIWKGWVDSAFTLQRAGYHDDANGFFEKCIAIYPYSDLRGRCAIGLAAGKPDEAYSRLLALTEANDPETINAALRLLGELAGSEGFPEASRAQVVERLSAFTGGLKKASYGLAACQGLVASGDAQAIPTLETLSKGMMNVDFYPCARRGLLLTFDQRSVVPLLEKQLKGGSFSTTEPRDRLFAAEILMQAGEASGFRWASEQFARKKSKGLKKFMKTEEEFDYQPPLVTALVRVGGDQARQVLREALEVTEKGTWLETWIAVGLLELGDTTSIDLVRTALGRPDWEFTTVRIATALAKHGDHSGIPALKSLYEKAAQGLEPDTGRAVLAFLAGEGASYESSREAKEYRLIRLRRQIAGALADIDQPDAVPVLVQMLGDPEPSVRMAAAYALARMTNSAVPDGLAEAITTDFGKSGTRSLNTEVHTHVARWSVRTFPQSAGTKAVLKTAGESPFTSVQFLSLCLSKAVGG